MMLQVNSCDYGHETAEETRRLPIGGDAGVIVCEEHYHAEMESRKLAALERGEPDYRGFPAWTELEVYEPRKGP